MTEFFVNKLNEAMCGQVVKSVIIDAIGCDHILVITLENGTRVDLRPGKTATDAPLIVGSITRTVVESGTIY